MSILTTENGLEVSNITIGSWGTGTVTWGEKNYSEIQESIEFLINNGINAIDTARIYEDAENILSDIIQKKDRASLFITSKCGRYRTSEGVAYSDATGENIIKDCETSLKTLKTDYLDLMLIHWPDPTIPIEESIEALAKLKTQGKVRFIGLSNFSVEEAKTANQIEKIDAVQGIYNLIDRSMEDLLLWGYENNLYTMGYGVLGAGILTGAYRTIPEFPANDSRLVFYNYFEKDNFERIQKIFPYLDSLSKKYNRNLAQISLKWITGLPHISTAIMGVRRLKHAKNNLISNDWDLTKAERNNLDNKLRELNII